MDKWLKAIVRLNELTQKGILKWEVSHPPNLSGTSDHVEIAFLTEYEGERLRIFKRRSKIALDEELLGWHDQPVLQIIDRQGVTRFDFPTSPALYDLISSVEYQTSGVGAFIDKLASDG
ncbi:MAG: hypothetical protein HY423_12555 [Candidatus Lambdaproteobacteria bacterium]|nr:hypothetical protein [Candidatus Lambdaproteobacteria bacterium]